MKKWIWLAALALLLLPQRGTEVGKLLPVETLLIEKQAEQYRVSADTGSAGRGDSLEKAVDALRAEAPGILFLDTADYVLLTGEAEEWKGCRTMCGREPGYINWRARRSFRRSAPI